MTDAAASPDSFANAAPGDCVVVSIVSHGHGDCVQRLLHELAEHCDGSVARVVLTHNLPESAPEPAQGAWPFALEVRVNEAPLGFGVNHNRALQNAQEPYVCVLNPDVMLSGNDPFPALRAALDRAGAGCAYPVQVDAQGVRQDSERALPTPLALVRRRLQGRAERRIDWVNAACLLLPRAVWQQLGGFDERYYMYCEDVDLCLRLRLAGFGLARAQAQVVHAGTRASHRALRHLVWHVTSLLRLWRSHPYRDAHRLLQARPQRAGSIGPK